MVGEQAVSTGGGNCHVYGKQERGSACYLITAIGKSADYEYQR